MKIIESKFEKDDLRQGKVYLWTHKENPRLVKIGYTGTGSEERRRQAGNCYAKNTVPVWESETRFVGPRRVESIVMAQLAEWNIPVVECAYCNRGHREWFEIDVEEVKQLLRSWTTFVVLFYVDGRLSAKGEQTLDKFCRIDPAKLVESHLLAQHNPSLEKNVEMEGLRLLSDEAEASQQSTLAYDQVGGQPSNKQVT
jgi:hypothetical protein